MNRLTTKKTSISFKCHYCGKGSDKTHISHRTTGTGANASRSVERGRRVVSGNRLNRSKSVHSTYLPPLNQNAPDFAYTPGRTITEDDLREELAQLKLRYTALNREHGLLKTHLRVATNDLKKREHEIENLLQDPVTMTKSQEQLELNSLKRKIIQYERALREKTQEINDLLSDKNILNVTETKQKLQKLETNNAKLKHRLERSVPYAELEAEKTKLAEMIETLQRENEELHHMLDAAFQEENSVILDANGMRDPKMLHKLKEEAAARRSEVEHYQRALSSLIRDRTLPAISTPTDLVPRITSAKPKKIGERSVSAKSRMSTDLSGTNYKMNGPVDAKRPLRPIKGANAVPRQNTVTLSNVPEVEPKSKAKSAKATKSTKVSKDEAEVHHQQPVKHINHLMHYEEGTESTIKSPDDLTPPESSKTKKEKKDDRKLSVGSVVTNGDYDNDSNIGAINAEYQEKEMEERIGSLVTALRCQLLREEMIQTRVMSF